jgi:Uma2 family endonuclease
MSVPASRWISPEEYLAAEREADYRSEYFNGQVFAMSGGTDIHSLIAANVTALLHLQLRRGPCRVFTSDLRIKVAVTGLYTYPDLSVICGPREYDDTRRDTALNPTVIIEVLSPKTAAYDRGDKFAHYQRISTLQEYVLISQDRARVERYLRHDTGWNYTDVTGLEGRVPLTSIGADLRLEEIYEGVELPEEPPLHSP